ncbi:HAD family hydrolase [Anaerosporobacter sp.]|uniref:HAD family hydrolase n=1 Tax=Anaerosporobacter sp. TaxID=1872529 RepID=UPI00286F5235|nr:HAD family hydrolase [Anaerosporobacter sp.]
MIKFIATDIDGTLLHSDQTLPNDLPQVINKLHEQNILFSVASGRPYLTLKQSFESLNPNIVYIADNGSHVVYQGKEVAVHAIDNTIVKELIHITRTLPCAYSVVCTTNGAYVESDEPAFLHELEKYYVKYTVVEDLTKLNESVIKYTICDLTGAEENSYPHFLPYQEKVQLSVAGFVWLDCMQKGINKGTAIKEIQDLYQITEEECMAFGDYLNDLEMMQSVYYSYAMANAHEDLKKVSRFETVSNDEDGVIITIKEMCDL